MTDNPLINAPARISDLPLADRKAAMLERDASRRDQWLQRRERRGLFARLIDRVRG